MMSLPDLHLTPNDEQAYAGLIQPIADASGNVPSAAVIDLLRRSGLDNTILQEIWKICADPSKPYFDRKASFSALRLVAFAQNGRPVNMTELTSKISVAVPRIAPAVAPAAAPPSASSAPTSAVVPVAVSAVAATDAGGISAAERANYEQHFRRSLPVDGYLTGEQAKGVLVLSQLPLETLGKVWALSDIDEDGRMDLDEFCVAMHLVRGCLDGRPLPETLPAALMPASKRKNATATTVTPVAIPATAAGAVTPATLQHTSSNASASGISLNATPSNLHLAMLSSSETPSHTSSDWAVPQAEVAMYNSIFDQLDTDRDGFVLGHEVKDTFMKSELPGPALAHAWSLADSDNAGKLDKEQFALALYLLAQKRKGIDMPTTLPSNLVPPSRRGKHAPANSISTTTTTTAPAPVVPETSSLVSVMAGAPPMPANEEASKAIIEDMAKKVDDAARELKQINQEVSEKQQNIARKEREANDLEEQLRAVTRELEQARREREETDRQLLALTARVESFESNIAETRKKCEQELLETNALRASIDAEQSSIKDREQQLQQAKQELQRLNMEELELTSQYDRSRAELSALDDQLKEVEEETDRVKRESEQLSAKLSELERTSSSLAKPVAASTGPSEDDPFSASNDDDAFGATKDVADPFSEVQSDPFGTPAIKTDPFGAAVVISDPFGSAPSKAAPPKPPKANDNAFASGQDYPFSSADPFGAPKKSADFTAKPDVLANDPWFSSTTDNLFTHKNASEGFASFPDSKSNSPFGGSDPFAAPAAVSASGPSLAPPKPSKNKPAFEDPFAPSGTAPASGAAADPFASDPFATNSSGSGGFGKFDDDPFK